MKLSRDFKEFIECFNANEVRYLIIGGYAVAHHGRPRYTKDLDIWVELGGENGLRIVEALKDFGFDSLGLKANDFDDPDTVVQLGYEPHRIDILTSAAGIDFGVAWSRQCCVDIDGVSVRVLGLTDLIANKQAVGRPQDLADVEAIRPPGNC